MQFLHFRLFTYSFSLFVTIFLVFDWLPSHTGKLRFLSHADLLSRLCRGQLVFLRLSHRSNWPLQLLYETMQS